MAVDQAGLVARVLLYLNVTIGGETPSTEDDATVDLAIAEIMAELEEKKLAYWAVSAIPESVARGMTIMVGANCATSFMSLSESAQYISAKRSGEALIREIIAQGSDHETTPHIYF
jgi:hypothetical protein